MIRECCQVGWGYPTGTFEYKTSLHALIAAQAPQETGWYLANKMSVIVEKKNKGEKGGTQKVHKG